MSLKQLAAWARTFATCSKLPRKLADFTMLRGMRDRRAHCIGGFRSDRNPSTGFSIVPEFGGFVSSRRQKSLQETVGASCSRSSIAVFTVVRTPPTIVSLETRARCSHYCPNPTEYGYITPSLRSASPHHRVSPSPHLRVPFPNSAFRIPHSF